MLKKIKQSLMKAAGKKEKVAKPIKEKKLKQSKKRKLMRLKKKNQK